MQTPACPPTEPSTPWGLHLAAKRVSRRKHELTKHECLCKKKNLCYFYTFSKIKMCCKCEIRGASSSRVICHVRRLEASVGKVVVGWRRVTGQWQGLSIATRVFLPTSRSSLWHQLCPSLGQNVRGLGARQQSFPELAHGVVDWHPWAG